MTLVELLVLDLYMFEGLLQSGKLIVSITQLSLQSTLQLEVFNLFFLDEEPLLLLSKDHDMRFHTFHFLFIRGGNFGYSLDPFFFRR